MVKVKQSHQTQTKVIDVYGQETEPICNLANQFGSLTKQFEYTVNLDGKQIFPKDTIKQNIVTKYKSENYNISSLNYNLLGFNITASNIKIHVNPSRTGQTTTRVDFPIVIARNISVTNASINLKYADVNLGSIYGSYNKNTDKMTMHIQLAYLYNIYPICKKYNIIAKNRHYLRNTKSAYLLQMKLVGQQGIKHIVVAIILVIAMTIMID